MAYKIESVGILSPGDMGHSVGQTLRENGLRVITCLQGRSERTRGLAKAAGIADVPTYGDLVRELLDGTSITKYGGGTLLSASGCASNNGTKSNPALTADIFGDWREEAIWRTSDNNYLRIYTTSSTTNHRIYTLMHDPIYRLGISWQNVAYNQPPHTGFFLGDGMSDPPTPDIYYP